MSSIDDLRRKFSVDAPPVEPEPMVAPVEVPMASGGMASGFEDFPAAPFIPCSDKGCIGPEGHLGEHLHDPKAEFDPEVYKLVVERLAAEQCPACGAPHARLSGDSDGMHDSYTCGDCAFAYVLDEPVMLVARNVKTAHALDEIFGSGPGASKSSKVASAVAAAKKSKERKRLVDAVKSTSTASSKARWALADDGDGDEDGILQFGQHSGSSISDLAQDSDGRSYLRWIVREGGFPERLLEIINLQMVKHTPAKTPPRRL